MQTMFTEQKAIIFHKFVCGVQILGRAQPEVMRNFFGPAFFLTVIVNKIRLKKYKHLLFIILEKNGKIFGVGFPVVEIKFLRILII